ncbi:very short patch repair endonuclease [Anaeromyxobacter oryzisoli]|uniref:very short patch repair endonuclease n=1 Tax=Anaeromyxobacter oryzisoli TaxID=2925408 RepID=UPI0027DFAC03|nr:very short patch repair endonuclease [Anaeromyxobacter sp. SG63]
MRRASSQPTDETRARMRAVKRSGTTPELQVRRALSGLGIRYRLNVRALPGSPDIANSTKKFAVFVNGCFWHRHPRCSAATTPSSNRAYWLKKFEQNVARDRRKSALLRKQGFRVIVVWECQTKANTLQSLLRRRFEGIRASPA